MLGRERERERESDNVVSDPSTVMCLRRLFISDQWKEGVTNMLLVLVYQLKPTYQTKAMNEWNCINVTASSYTTYHCIVSKNISP